MMFIRVTGESFFAAALRRTLAPLLSAGMLLAAAAASAGDAATPVHGIYGHPKPLWDKGLRLDELGINAVFVGDSAIDAALVERVKAEGCRIFAEFPTLNGKKDNWVAEHPDAHPIDATGQPAPPATWFMGVCPTNREFREHRMQALRALLTEHALDGVWADYLHWHAQFEDPYPVFVKTCFGDSCLAAFEQWAGVKVVGTTVPEKAAWIFAQVPGQWEDWRVSVINDWAREIASITHELRPGALVGSFHAAWKDEDLWGVRRRALGLDLKALAESVDVFSPMIYHRRAGKSADYVSGYIDYFGRAYAGAGKDGVTPRLWPIVQASQAPAAEFERVLRDGLSGASSGVMMFTVRDVATDPEKLEAMRRVYAAAAR